MMQTYTPIAFLLVASIGLGQEGRKVAGEYFIKPDVAEVVSDGGDRFQAKKGDRLLVIERVDEQSLRGFWGNSLEVRVAAKDVIPLDKAADYFERLAEEQPSSMNLVARGFVALYSAIYERKPAKLKAALQDFQEAVELDPNNARAYLGRAEAHGSLGNREEQMADYARALRADPNFLEAYWRRSSLLDQFEEDQLHQAIGDLTHVIRLAPAWAEAYSRRARLRTELADLLEIAAERDRQKAAELEEGPPSTTPPRRDPQSASSRPRDQRNPVEGKIVVVYPNGGEQIKRGEPFEVRWKTEGEIERVRIVVHGGPDENAGGWYTVTEDTPNTGAYKMTIPRNWGWPIFKVHVTSIDRAVKDASDDHFTAK